MIEVDVGAVVVEEVVVEGETAWERIEEIAMIEEIGAMKKVARKYSYSLLVSWGITDGGLSARLQYLQCVSTGDIAVLH